MVAHQFDMEEVIEIEHTLGKGSRKPVDENAPKRPLSAYFLFSNKMRPSVLKANEDISIASIGKELGILWRAASDSEKAPFEKKAAADQKTYQGKMEKYQKTGNYKKHQMKLLAWKIHETKKPFRKDENAPKRTLSAYMLYSASVRKQITKENPDISAVEVVQEQSAMWKALGDSDRKKWVDKAGAEKKKYDAKLARYMKTADYQKHFEEKNAYKAEMKEKRNKLMGIKKRARTPTKAKSAPKSPSKKKAKRSSRRSRTPKASKSRSVSRRRRRRRSKSPKSPKRLSRKRRAEKKKTRTKRTTTRKSRTPKSSKSRSKSRSGSRSKSRSTSRSRSAKRRSASRSKSRRKSTSRRSKKTSE